MTEREGERDPAGATTIGRVNCCYLSGDDWGLRSRLMISEWDDDYTGVVQCAS